MLEHHPDHADALAERANLRVLHLRDFEGGKADYERALALKPDAPWALEAQVFLNAARGNQ